MTARLRNKSSINGNVSIDLVNVSPTAPISYTIHWDELPEWSRDNSYIVSGYRRVQNSWKAAFRSVFSYLHNETVNIHSHLWGAVFFVYLGTTISKKLNQYPTAWIDYGVFFVFLVAATTCLSGSALYHTSICHSEAVSKSMQKIDYSGIVILIVGSFYPCLYYGFYCQPVMQVVYIGGITILGIAAAYVVLSPTYGTPAYRGTRTAIFIALGLFAIVPTLHWAALHGIHKLFLEMGFEWLALSGALYIGGALLYANRIPERFAPGTFDYFFASHQIFHLCVVCAASAHFVSMLKALDHTYSSWHPCPA
ncbi:hemolysin-III related-domain-containing protein [Flagelloscypha sp. PMI_526]|nr:hemolysin-III related-domain-containing protein [Flagelloscypha sp. PMI_526]